jgi:hypothetical protein
MTDPERQAVADAIKCLDEGMQGIVRWMYTLKPVLRNELLQMTEPQMEKVREARERLAALLGDPPAPAA